jgi:RNA polymerase sigma-70 factor (ECF subfamily)
LGVKLEIINRIREQARSRWPDLELDLEVFQQHVDRLGIDEVRLSSHGVDLLLASAVLDGNPAALRVFDSILASVAVIAGRVEPSRSFIDDVSQELRVKLLTGKTPKLLGYGAVGSLSEWLKVVALRMALNMKRSDHMLPTDDIPVAAVLGSFDDVQMKQFYLQELNEAIESCFNKLTVRERTLLRLHFVDGLNIERIGVMYGVHRATVARWLVTIRQHLFEELRERLALTHGLDTTDVRSLYRRMQQDVHVTISRVLQA